MKREKLYVYEGGNFINIVKPGYAEQVKKQHYLGGSLLVVSMNVSAIFTRKEFANARALANDIVKVYNEAVERSKTNV